MTEINGITITDNMRDRAKKEARKRHPTIKHHFEVAHFTSEQRDELGFIGEFAACIFLNINWEENIRSDYKTIDSHDLIINNKKIDIKTESVPGKFLQKIISREITDNEIFGRRLINFGQGNLIKKYDIVVFGVVDRDKMDLWYPVGWITSQEILDNYEATVKRPDGGKYPFKAFPIKTSDLKDLKDL